MYYVQETVYSVLSTFIFFQVMESPLQSSSKTRGLPGLPPLPSDKKDEPSELYQVFYFNNGIVWFQYFNFFQSLHKWDNENCEFGSMLL